MDYTKFLNILTKYTDTRYSYTAGLFIFEHHLTTVIPGAFLALYYHESPQLQYQRCYTNHWQLAMQNKSLKQIQHAVVLFWQVLFTSNPHCKKKTNSSFNWIKVLLTVYCSLPRLHREKNPRTFQRVWHQSAFSLEMHNNVTSSPNMWPGRVLTLTTLTIKWICP